MGSARPHTATVVGLCVCLLAAVPSALAAYSFSGYSSVCVLTATDKNNDPFLKGTVLFQELADKNLLITLNVTGLSNGNHSFHVHLYGDVSGRDGMATGGHFVGDCDNCRPAGMPQEAGLLNNGTKLPSWGGEASQQFVEYVAKLSGTNSIEGRAIIIHGNEVSASVRVAQCVIGRASGNLASPILRPAVKYATCNLEKTSNSPTSISGKVLLEEVPLSDNILVKWDIQGLVADMTHGFHVHTWGDIRNPNGQSVAGHFIGNCDGSCRPNNPQEVGNLFDGAGIQVAAGVTRVIGENVDKVIKLGGVDNVVGRALIIHGDASSAGVRVAQCVIGEAATPDPEDLPAPPGGWEWWMFALVVGLPLLVCGVALVAACMCCKCGGDGTSRAPPATGPAQDVLPPVATDGEAAGAVVADPTGARVRTNPIHAEGVPLATSDVARV